MAKVNAMTQIAQNFIHHITTGILALLPVLVSCGRMDDVYKEFLDDGDEIYLAKLKEVEVFSGEGRVMFVIPPQTDPRITGVHFSWDNDARTEDVAISIRETNEIILENVSDGSHIFYLQSTDGRGHKSVSVSLSASAYGESFLSALDQAEILSAARNSEGYGFFQIHHASIMYYQGMELSYADLSGKEKTILVPRGTNTLFVYDFGGDSFSYRSVYVPAENCFENLFSERITVTDIVEPKIDAPEEVSLPFARGYYSETPCICTWETSVFLEPADAASWLEVSLSGNTLKVRTLARNGGTSARIANLILESDNIRKVVPIIQQALSPKIGTAYGNDGVIFWQDPDRPNEYKIISASGNRRPWSTFYTITRATSYSGRTVVNGVEYDNNQLIRQMPDYGVDNDYALSWVESLGEGWYMPSVNELKDEFWPVFNGTVFEESSKTNFNKATDDEKECRTRFETTMASIGGMAINMGTKTSAGSAIMTCTETDAATCVGFRVSNSAIITVDKQTPTFFARGIKRVVIE